MISDPEINAILPFVVVVVVVVAGLQVLMVHAFIMEICR